MCNTHFNEWYLCAVGFIRGHIRAGLWCCKDVGSYEVKLATSLQLGPHKWMFQSIRSNLAPLVCVGDMWLGIVCVCVCLLLYLCSCTGESLLCDAISCEVWFCTSSQLDNKVRMCVCVCVCVHVHIMINCYRDGVYTLISCTVSCSSAKITANYAAGYLEAGPSLSRPACSSAYATGHFLPLFQNFIMRTTQEKVRRWRWDNWLTLHVVDFVQSALLVMI